MTIRKRDNLKVKLEGIRTPLFVIKESELEAGAQKMEEALQSAWPNYIIGYSYKTNAFTWIIEYFKNRGYYAEVVSDDEYELAKSIGTNRVIYNGLAKSKETFLEAVRNHSIVNIDSEYEIGWLDELEANGYEVGIRVNFDLEAKCPGQTQCGEDGERFGFCYENGELKKAIDEIESKGVRVTGLHLHKSSKTRMPDIYCAIANAAVEIAEKYALDIKYVDIGGGFFGGLSWKPQFSEYFNSVSSILHKRFSPDFTTLIVEPGMALIGAVVDYVSTVLDVKRTTRNTFVVTDGSRTQIDPLLTKSSYFYEIVKDCDCDRKIENRQIIAGFTCMEHDRLFEIANEPELLPGDKIIYHKVGAYTMSLSPLFIKYFPDIYVEDKRGLHKVRNAWGVHEYKQG